MKINFIIDKETNFYYWLQISADWGNSQIVPKMQKYFREFLQNLTEQERENLGKIEKILRKSQNPRKILAELYLRKNQSREAQKIVKFAEILRPHFEKIWQKRAPDLKNYQKKLEKFDFQKLNSLFKKVKKFYASTIDFSKPLKFYLLINSDTAFCYGFKITGIDEMMLAPDFRKKIGAQENLTTICHEICHAIENKSPISDAVIRDSFAKILRPKNLRERANFSWRQMYNEALTLSFAGHSTRGIFAKKLFPNSYRVQTNSEDKKSFLKYAAKNSVTNRDLTVLAGMLIEDDVARYLKSGQKIDARLVDKISEIFLQFGEI